MSKRERLLKKRAKMINKNLLRLRSLVGLKRMRNTSWLMKKIKHQCVRLRVAGLIKCTASGAGFSFKKIKTQCVRLPTASLISNSPVISRFSIEKMRN